MRSPRSRAEPDPQERGAAVVDFVLVALVLVPLALGVMQVALVLHVRDTLVAAAGEGARYGAVVDRTPANGARRARELIAAALSSRYAERVTATRERDDGLPTVVVRVRAVVPALGLWGPGVSLSVSGHAVAEVP